MVENWSLAKEMFEEGITLSRIERETGILRQTVRSESISAKWSTKNRKDYHKLRIEEKLETINGIDSQGEPIYRDQESIRVRAYMKVKDLRLLLEHCIENSISPTSFINSAVLAKLDIENERKI